MMRFLTRNGCSPDTRPQKRQRPEEQEDNPAAPEPSTFLTWNVNSLPTRCKDDGDIKGFCSLITQLDPDIIALQEARLTAHAPDKAKRGDGQQRDRGRPRDNDKASKEEWLAVKALLERAPFNRYQVIWSLADWRYAGTATLIKKTLRRPTKVEYNLEGQTDKAGRSSHDENGRLCLLHYPSGLAVLNMYAPNNGWKEDSFLRRRDWDAMLMRFVQRWRASGQPLVWLGDMNVAHRTPDVTHPDFFRTQVDRNAPKPAPEDVGQPGFTPNEQLRFGEVLERGDLVDTFRHMHPASQPPPPDQPAWTWRGSHHQTDKYHNKGMRIDYALVSKSLVDRIVEVRIVGRGADRSGFYGSDHCPMFLRLQSPPPPPGELQPLQTEGRGIGGTNPAAGQEAGSLTSAAAGDGVTTQISGDLVIQHDPTRSMFTARPGTGPGTSAATDPSGSAGPGPADSAPHLLYVMSDRQGVQVMDICHTFTPEHLRGQGMAAKLCAAAFEHCREAGCKVIASCSYVRDRFVLSRPDLASLLHADS